MKHIVPLFESKFDGSIYIMDFNYEVFEIEPEDIDDSEYITIDGSPKADTYNIRFLRFIIRSTKSEVQYEEAIKIADKLCNLDQNVWVDPRSALMDMARFWCEPGIEQLFEKYQEYYNTVGIPLVDNVNHYNAQRIEIDYKNLILTEFVDTKHLELDRGKCYLRFHANAFETKTGRLNSTLYSNLKSWKPFLIPRNTSIVEIDTVAAEWNFLLYMAGELNELPPKQYWNVLLSEINIDTITAEQLKLILYMRIYGAVNSTISAELKVSESLVQEVEDQLEKRFPKAFAYIRGSQNPYFSRESSMVYDYFGKEMLVEHNYTKLNYVIQSSLATHFQIFVYKLRKLMEEREMRTNIVFTVHDSMYVDLLDSEKVAFAEAIRETNNSMKPGFRFVQKT